MSETAALRSGPSFPLRSLLGSFVVNAALLTCIVIRPSVVSAVYLLLFYLPCFLPAFALHPPRTKLFLSGVAILSIFGIISHAILYGLTSDNYGEAITLDCAIFAASCLGLVISWRSSIIISSVLQRVSSNVPLWTTFMILLCQSALISFPAYPIGIVYAIVLSFVLLSKKSSTTSFDQIFSTNIVLSVRLISFVHSVYLFVLLLGNFDLSDTAQTLLGFEFAKAEMPLAASLCYFCGVHVKLRRLNSENPSGRLSSSFIPSDRGSASFSRVKLSISEPLQSGSSALEENGEREDTFYKVEIEKQSPLWSYILFCLYVGVLIASSLLWITPEGIAVLSVAVFRLFSPKRALDSSLLRGDSFVLWLVLLYRFFVVLSASLGGPHWSLSTSHPASIVPIVVCTIALFFVQRNRAAERRRSFPAESARWSVFLPRFLFTAVLLFAVSVEIDAFHLPIAVVLCVSMAFGSILVLWRLVSIFALGLAFSSYIVVIWSRMPCSGSENCTADIAMLLGVSFSFSALPALFQWTSSFFQSFERLSGLSDLVSSLVVLVISLLRSSILHLVFLVHVFGVVFAIPRASQSRSILWMWRSLHVFAVLSFVGTYAIQFPEIQSLFAHPADHDLERAGFPVISHPLPRALYLGGEVLIALISLYEITKPRTSPERPSALQATAAGDYSAMDDAERGVFAPTVAGNAPPPSSTLDQQPQHHPPSPSNTLVCKPSLHDSSTPFREPLINIVGRCLALHAGKVAAIFAACAFLGTSISGISGAVFALGVLGVAYPRVRRGLWAPLALAAMSSITVIAARGVLRAETATSQTAIYLGITDTELYPFLVITMWLCVLQWGIARSGIGRKVAREGRFAPLFGGEASLFFATRLSAENREQTALHSSERTRYASATSPTVSNGTNEHASAHYFAYSESDVSTNDPSSADKSHKRQDDANSGRNDTESLDAFPEWSLYDRIACTVDFSGAAFGRSIGLLSIFSLALFLRSAISLVWIVTVLAEFVSPIRAKRNRIVQLCTMITVTHALLHYLCALGAPSGRSWQDILGIHSSNVSSWSWFGLPLDHNLRHLSYESCALFFLSFAPKDVPNARNMLWRMWFGEPRSKSAAGSIMRYFSIVSLSISLAIVVSETPRTVFGLLMIGITFWAFIHTLDVVEKRVKTWRVFGIAISVFSVIHSIGMSPFAPKEGNELSWWKNIGLRFGSELESLVPVLFVLTIVNLVILDQRELAEIVAKADEKRQRKARFIAAQQAEKRAIDHVFQFQRVQVEIAERKNRLLLLHSRLDRGSLLRNSSVDLGEDRESDEVESRKSEKEENRDESLHDRGKRLESPHSEHNVGNGEKEGGIRGENARVDRVEIENEGEEVEDGEGEGEEIEPIDYPSESPPSSISTLKIPERVLFISRSIDGISTKIRAYLYRQEAEMEFDVVKNEILLLSPPDEDEEESQESNETEITAWNALIALFRSIMRFIVACIEFSLFHSAALCVFAVFLNHFESQSIGSGFLLCVTVFIGLVQYPRPRTWFWKLLILYGTIALFIKGVLVLPAMRYECGKAPHGAAEYLCERAARGIVSDALLVTLTLLHRATLIRRGLWNNSSASRLRSNVISDILRKKRGAESAGEGENGAQRGESGAKAASSLRRNDETSAEAAAALRRDGETSPKSATSLPLAVPIGHQAAVEAETGFVPARDPGLAGARATGGDERSIPCDTKTVVSTASSTVTDHYALDAEVAVLRAHGAACVAFHERHAAALAIAQDRTVPVVTRARCRAVAEYYRAQSYLRWGRTPGIDLYTPTVTIQALMFLVMLFGYELLYRGTSDSLSNALQENRISWLFVRSLLIQFVLIIVERFAYIRRSTPGKVVVHIGTIVYFLWLFGGAVRSGAAWFLWFVLFALYAVFSAAQLRVGLPAMHTSSSLTRSYSTGAMVKFYVFRAAPFVPELRIILDWSVTRTALELWEWLKLSEISADLYLAKCRSEARATSGRQQGDPQPLWLKLLQGWSVFFLLSLVIFLPLVLFSSVSPVVLTPNPVDGVSATVSLAGPLGTFQLLEATQAKVVDVASQVELQQLIDDRRPLSSSENFKLQDMQTVALYADSASVWGITPPGRAELVQMVSDHNESVSLRVSLELSQEASQTTARFDTATTLSPVQVSNISAVLAGDTGAYFDVIDAYPSVVRLPGSGAAASMLSDHGPALRLSLNRSAAAEWWSVTRIGGRTTGPRGPVTLVETRGLAAGVFGSLLSYGIIGLYVVFVLAVSRFLRSSTVLVAVKIPLTDLPDGTDVLQLSRDIEAARQEGDLALEEALYRALIDLYRSPETLFEYTKLKQD